jgi:hypothetical protein
VNIEILIELFSHIYDRGELDAEFVRDHRFRFAKRELNADFRLRRRSAAFPQHARGVGDGMFAEFNRHRRHEPFRFERWDKCLGQAPRARSVFACLLSTPPPAGVNFLPRQPKKLEL